MKIYGLLFAHVCLSTPNNPQTKCCNYFFFFKWTLFSTRIQVCFQCLIIFKHLANLLLVIFHGHFSVFNLKWKPHLCTLQYKLLKHTPITSLDSFVVGWDIINSVITTVGNLLYATRKEITYISWMMHSWKTPHVEANERQEYETAFKLQKLALSEIKKKKNVLK